MQIKIRYQLRTKKGTRIRTYTYQVPGNILGAEEGDASVNAYHRFGARYVTPRTNTNSFDKYSRKPPVEWVVFVHGQILAARFRETIRPRTNEYSPQVFERLFVHGRTNIRPTFSRYYSSTDERVFASCFRGSIRPRTNIRPMFSRTVLVHGRIFAPRFRDSILSTDEYSPMFLSLQEQKRVSILIGKVIII